MLLILFKKKNPEPTLFQQRTKDGNRTSALSVWEAWEFRWPKTC